MVFKTSSKKNAFISLFGTYKHFYSFTNNFYFEILIVVNSTKSIIIVPIRQIKVKL